MYPTAEKEEEDVQLILPGNPYWTTFRANMRTWTLSQRCTAALFLSLSHTQVGRSVGRVIDDSKIIAFCNRVQPGSARGREGSFHTKPRANLGHAHTRCGNRTGSSGLSINPIQRLIKPLERMMACGEPEELRNGTGCRRVNR